MGAIVGGELGVQVGGGAVGGSVGAGSGMPVGSGVSVGSGLEVGSAGLGVGGMLVGEATGEGVGVRLGCSVDVGRGVFVARASAIRVLVGVGVIAGAPGLQRRVSSGANGSRTRTIMRPGFLIILLMPAHHHKDNSLMCSLARLLALGL